tara:strand:- start:1008 stop:1325 length:318 start_codon:yes stop_codon:yes gene_type:complete
VIATITIIVLSILLIISGFIIWNLLRKVERHEDFSNQLSKWVDGLNQIATKIISQLDVIDEKGMFKSDDYVGSIYTQINQLVRELEGIIVKENEDDKSDTTPFSN